MPETASPPDLTPVSRAEFLQLAARVRYVEKQLDTHGSPWWRRLWFRIDGHKPWWIVDPRRSWRPWHRSELT